MTELEKYIAKIVNFDKAELVEINSLTKQLVVDKDDFLLKEGEICHTIGFLLEGILEMTYVDEKLEEHIIEFIFPNSFVTDYVSFLTKSKSDCNIKAIKKSTILYFEKDSIEKLYDKSLNFQKFGRLISESYFLGFADRIKKRSLPLNSVTKTCLANILNFFRQFLNTRLPPILVSRPNGYQKSGARNNLLN